ncbi:MAG: DUF362 domain-containing protein, partial [Sphaerochaetaceae bacterium]|nr:DUF362 domain-containing protein [Sphaerochaetaceae bacterium]
MTEVAITKCQFYNSNEVYNAIKEICIKANMPSVSGKKVLLKPNILSDANAEDCITTHPEVVRAVIKLLKEQGALEIYVGDSPGLHSSSFHGKKCGIYDVCEEEGATWVDFSDSPVTKKIGKNKIQI